jgi:glycosyltransferase involved in cell wall biosynthesis
VTTRPKVLVASTTFPKYMGDPSAAPFVFDLCNELSSRYEITVAAPHHPGAALVEKMAGLRVLRFPYFWPTSSQRLADGVGLLPNIRSSALGKVQAPTLFAAETLFINKLLTAENFDLIHSHWMVPGGLAAALARRARRIPHVLTVHSTDVHLLRQIPLGASIARFILNRTDAMFVVSTFLEKMLSTLVGSPVDAQVLPMGVNEALDDSIAGPDPVPEEFRDKRLVLYAGKLIEVKGVEYLVRGFAKVRKAFPDARLLIVGGGDKEQVYRREMRNLGLGDVIEFTGPLPHETLLRLYGRAEMLAFSSIVTDRGETEGLPVVILESLAAGTPVVTTDVGSLSDVVKHGENGLLVPQRDPDALAGAIIELLAKKDLSGLRAGAKKSIEPYTWPRIAERYAEVYDRLIGPR